jgi:hypothetical protein
MIVGSMPDVGRQIAEEDRPGQRRGRQPAAGAQDADRDRQIVGNDGPNLAAQAHLRRASGRTTPSRHPDGALSERGRRSSRASTG